MKPITHLRPHPVGIAILLGLLLGSCAPTPPPADVTTISFACHDYQMRLFEPLVEDFQKSNPELRVQLVSIEEALSRENQGNIAVATSDDFGHVAAVADALIWYASPFMDWAYVLNLQPLLDQEPAFPFDDFFPGLLDDLRWHGDLYGLPAEVHPMLFFYDRGILDEISLEYPRIGWGWDDLVNMAARATRREGGETTRYGLVVPYLYSRDIVLAMLKQQRISLWEPADPSVPRFNQPEVARTMERFTNWALVDPIMPLPTSELAQDHQRLIREGKAAFWVDYAFGYAPHAEIGLAPFPEDLSAANPRTFYAFFVSAGASHPEAAWRWLRYLSDHYLPSRGGFSREGVTPARRSTTLQEMQSWNADEDKKTAVAYALEHPSFAVNILYYDLGNALSSIFKGEASLESALENAQERAISVQKRLAESAQADSVHVSPVPTAPVPPVDEDTSVITFAPYLTRERPLYQALAAEFHERNPDTRVEVRYPTLDLFSGTDLPDCFAGALPSGDPHAREILLNLTPLLGAGPGLSPDDFYPALLASQRHEDQLWGIPYEADALFVYYNRALLDQAGVAPPEPGWSIHAFLEAAGALSAVEGRYGFTTRSGEYGDLRFALQWLGADLFDIDQTPSAVTFDDPSVADALNRYAALNRLHALTPAVPSKESGWPEMFVWGRHPARVESGQVGLWVDFLDNYTVSPQLPFPAGVAPLPARDWAGATGAVNYTEFLVRAYYISAGAPGPQTCWEWIQFLSDKAEVVQLLPARRSIAAGTEWQSRVDPAALPAYLATLEYDHMPLFVPDLEKRWLPYIDPWLDETYKAVLAGGDAGAALDVARQKAAGLMECYDRLDDYPDVESILSCARGEDPNYPQP